MKRPALLLLAVLVLGALVGTTGCSKRYKIEIQSDTCWDGVIDDGQGFFDCGNASYKVVGPMRCVRVIKRTNNGFLRVRIDGGAWVETTDPQGVVQACR